MAAKYRKVDPRIWRDEKFVELDAIDKLIVHYVLTSLQANRIGLFTFSVALAAEELGIKVETFRERFANVCQTFQWPYDPRTKTLFLKTWWKYNRPDNPNMLKSCLEDLHDLPASDLITAFLNNTRYLPETFAAILRNVGGNVGGNVSPQEQEQEQEQKQEMEQEQEGDANRDDTGDTPSPPPPPTRSSPHAPRHPSPAPRSSLRAGRGPETVDEARIRAMTPAEYADYYDRQAAEFFEVATDDAWPMLKEAGRLAGEIKRLRNWALMRPKSQRKVDIGAFLHNNLNVAELESARPPGHGFAEPTRRGGAEDLEKMDYANHVSGFKRFNPDAYLPDERE
jgi:hypothetical protein